MNSGEFKAKIQYIFILVVLSISCNWNSNQVHMDRKINIVLLHHSTGMAIWNGNTKSIQYQMGRIQKKIFGKPNPHAKLLRLFKKYNRRNNTSYQIEEMTFPKAVIYGWNNYPYDYYNIWVKHAGDQPYMEESTLEILTKEYQVIIFKHCFPVGLIQANQDSADIDSDYRSLANYKLQYLALRDKLNQFEDSKFILWTGAALVKNQCTEEEVVRSLEFFNWVKNEWDQADDNIFLWDFYELETGGEIYMKEEYAVSSNNSHPNKRFADYCAVLLFDRIIDIVKTNGTATSLTGLKK